jgi:hypothetical protein
MLNEAMHDTTDLAMNSGARHGDETLLVKFFKKPKLNSAKTTEAGRPIYEERDHIQIMQPGNKDSIIIRPATNMDRDRFAEHFRRYEAREDQEAIEGTMLEDWAGITRSQCEELKYLNIRTVEQLVSVSDSNAQNVMGITHMKQRAKKYLDDTAGDATAEALETAKNEIAELKAAFAAMQEGQKVNVPVEEIRPLEKIPEPKKRTRRTKAQMEAAKATTE